MKSRPQKKQMEAPKKKKCIRGRLKISDETLTPGKQRSPLKRRKSMQTPQNILRMYLPACFPLVEM